VKNEDDVAIDVFRLFCVFVSNCLM